eukprot:GFUD01132349.1.p1 GENE.GFUD01132349.1~~GFUD01132349.1.p1  ORF type:complete len:123 (-),score=3.53 GFUD01132349.1:24-356(-)
MGTSGTFGWTDSPFGCDWMPKDGTNNPIGGFLMIISNFMFIVIFYSAVIVHICTQKSQVSGPGYSNRKQIIRSISLTLLLMVVVYIACLAPLWFGFFLRSNELDILLISM